MWCHLAAVRFVRPWLLSHNCYIYIYLHIIISETAGGLTCLLMKFQQFVI